MYVLPISLFILLNVVFIKVKPFFNQKENLFVLLMIMWSAFMSIINNELWNIFPITLFYTSILILLHNKYHVYLYLLNFLYILTLIFAFISTEFGINEYGILPGQGAGMYEKPVSLFPLAIVGSAYFSLYLIFYNYFLNKSFSKWIFILVGVYFVYFSYNRTSLLCLIFFFCSIVIYSRFSSKNRIGKILYAYAFVTIIIVGLFSTVLLSTLFTVTNEEISAIITKESGNVDDELIGSARPFLITQQFQLFLNNIITGTSSFRLNNVYSASGSETFFTGMLANIGIAFVFFALYIHRKLSFAIDKANLSNFLSIPMMLLTFMLYGVLVLPYDFISLLIFSAMNFKSD